MSHPKEAVSAFFGSFEELANPIIRKVLPIQLSKRYVGGKRRFSQHRLDVKTYSPRSGNKATRSTRRCDEGQICFSEWR